jgi:hypothetical protein
MVGALCRKRLDEFRRDMISLTRRNEDFNGGETTRKWAHGTPPSSANDAPKDTTFGIWFAREAIASRSLH